MPLVFNSSLYLITDLGLSCGRTNLDIVRAAVKGGVTMVQLREKEIEEQAFVKEAKALKKFLASLNIPLIINDNVDVALESGADGVHLGQDDMAPAEARRILGREAIIGLSVGSVEEMALFDPAVVDYVGIGPAFATTTKTNAGAALGVEGIRKLRKMISVPCVAIGGINQSNAADIMQSGVDGIAVVSAICAADDPEKAAMALKAAMA